MRTGSSHKPRLTAARLALLLSLLIVLSNACSGFMTEPSPTPTPRPSATPNPTPSPTPLPDGYEEYFSQSGDTLSVVAAHFGADAADILMDGSPSPDATLILDPGTRLLVPAYQGETTRPDLLFPDSAVIYSPATIGFDVQVFADEQDGFFAKYTEVMTRGNTSASEILEQLAFEFSINPRLLLAVIEFESGWLTVPKPTKEQIAYPFGWPKSDRSGIYFQSGLAIKALSYAYYDWRAGYLTDLTFRDGETLRLAPQLNAGTVAVMHLFAQNHTREEWEEALYGPDSVVAIHTRFFGDAFELGAGVDPIFAAGTRQPQLNLPFPPNQVWNLTGGPHTAWGSGWRRIGSLAALDFAPPLDRPGCGTSHRFTTAAAGGLVVRARNGAVVIDLDQDGYEQTGWVLLYMHVSNGGRVQVGDVLAQDDNVGHPSCVGGSSSGIHVHFARKFNGEWVAADGGLPLVLSGYRAYKGEDYYKGTLVRANRLVTANLAGNSRTRIVRPESLPKYLYTPTPRK